MDEKTMQWLFTGAIGIIFFFIRNSVFTKISELDTKYTTLEGRVSKNETKIEVAERDHVNLDKRFDEMNNNFKELSREIKESMIKMSK